MMMMMVMKVVVMIMIMMMMMMMMVVVVVVVVVVMMMMMMRITIQRRVIENKKEGKRMCRRSLPALFHPLLLLLFCSSASALDCSRHLTVAPQVGASTV